MHIRRDSAPVVVDRYAAVLVYRDENVFTVSGKCFVYRVVDYFINEMVQSALSDIADVHSGAFPDRLQPLQYCNTVRVIRLSVVRLPFLRIFGHDRRFLFVFPVGLIGFLRRCFFSTFFCFCFTAACFFAICYLC